MLQGVLGRGEKGEKGIPGFPGLRVRKLQKKLLHKFTAIRFIIYLAVQVCISKEDFKDFFKLICHTSV